MKTLPCILGCAAGNFIYAFATDHNWQRAFAYSFMQMIAVLCHRYVFDNK
jgi:hypothetical protein